MSSGLVLCILGGFLFGYSIGDNNPAGMVLGAGLWLAGLLLP